MLLCEGENSKTARRLGEFRQGVVDRRVKQ
jgi:hypothetical protein